MRKYVNPQIKKRPCLGQHDKSCLQFVIGTPERRLCNSCHYYIDRLESSDKTDQSIDEYEWEKLWKQAK